MPTTRPAGATLAALAAFATAAALALGGCSSLPQAPSAKATFDLGPLPAGESVPTAAPQTPAAQPPQLRLAATTAPQALGGTDMGYRLVYAQPLQPRTYTLARWSMPPALLVHQQLQAALVADGWQLSADHSPQMPVLQVEVDVFEQVFDAAERSQGQVQWRVSLRQGQATLAQTRIVAQSPAPTPDAAGGAQALATATALATTQLRTWLAPHRQTASGARQP
jgi:cholesterol transport system auxiliary component